jgi:hypothetical protein
MSVFPAPHLTEAERQKAHYSAVRQRLRANAIKPAIVQPKLIETRPAPVSGTPKPYVTLRGAIMSMVEGHNIPRCKLHSILIAVAMATGVSQEDILSNDRHQPLTMARKLFYYLAREHTDKSFPAIADFIGRDHTTVIAGYYSVKNSYKRFKDLIEQVRDELLPDREAA